MQFQFHRHRLLTVVPLRHLIKELAASADFGRHPCPSVVINEACRQLQEIMDDTINDIPSRLLLYFTSFSSAIDLCDSIDQIYCTSIE
jgi:hypothetical protein